MADIFSSQSGKIIFKSPVTDKDKVLELDMNGNVFVSGDMVLTGNLTVQGSGTAKDLSSLLVEDPVIVANFGEEAIPGGDTTSRGFIVDRGAFSIIEIDDPNNPGKLKIVQRMKKDAIVIDGTGEPVFRDDPKSYHGQYLPGTPPSIDDTTPTPTDIVAPRAIVWDESNDTWDLTWAFGNREDTDGNPFAITTTGPVDIKGIATPNTIPDITNIDNVSNIDYVNQMTAGVQSDLDDLNLYLNTATANSNNHIMYWNSTSEQYDSKSMNIKLDTSPELGGNLDVLDNEIVSTNSDIVITPQTDKVIKLDKNTWPSDKGSSGQIMTVDDNGAIAWTDIPAGEVYTMDNLGSGTGIYAKTTNNKFELNSLKAGTNVTLTSADNEITINSTATGEVYTMDNLGSGTGIYAKTTNNKFELNSLKAGTNVTLTSANNEITINSTATSNQTITAGSGLTGGGSSSTVTLNVGSGTGITVEADLVKVDDTVVVTTGDQTIAGVKEFSGTITTKYIDSTNGVVDFGVDQDTGQSSVDINCAWVQCTEITASGPVGGTTGDFSDEVQALSFNTTSALHYKENVTPFENALNKVMGIDVINYVSKGDVSRKKRLGVSAESLSKVVPELVAYKNGIPDAVNYAQGFALLTQAIQEQENRRPLNRIKRIFSKLTTLFKRIN